MNTVAVVFARRRGRMTVVAVPNPHYPPAADALALAGARVPTAARLTPQLIDQL